MAGPINLEALDAPIVEQTKFEPDMQRWLTNIVDIINASFITITNGFANLIFTGQVSLSSPGTSAVISVTGLLATNYVNVTVVSTTNANITASVTTVSSGSFTVTFSADPGTSAIIAYQAFSSQPL